MRLILGPTAEYFLWSIAVGAILAAVYDVLRISRKLIKKSDILVNAEDGLFIIMSGGVASILAYIVNNGVFRIHSLFGMGIGFFGYRILIGNRVIKLFMIMYGFLCKALKCMCRAIAYPIRFVVRVIKKPVFIVIGGAKRKLKSVNSKK